MRDRTIVDRVTLCCDLGTSCAGAGSFGDRVTAGLTIANLSDTEPPMMAHWAWGGKNTDTRMYDIFGRSNTLSVSLLY